MIATDLVTLAGGPVEVGAAYGSATAECIRSYLADFLASVEIEGIGIDEIRRRTDIYVRGVEQLAPWWRAEMAAIATAAGVAVDDYAAYVAQKYVIRTTQPPSPPPAPHECTSFVAAGRASLDGASILHKNRDSAARAQGLWIRHNDGCYRYLGGGDSGDHGVIHFVNEQGLAGAMNAGPPNDDTEYDGWPTPQTLRLVAERAANCQEALEVVQEIVGRGWYTNGVCGSIWFFADDERALIVENTRHDLEATWITDAVVARANDFLLPTMRKYSRPDFETNTRYLSARDGAAALDGRVTPFGLIQLARDEATAPRAMCAESTLSGFTASVAGERGRPLGALVTVGNPASCIATPYFVAAAGVPSFVIDGRLWAAADQYRRARLTGQSNPAVTEAERQIAAETADLLAQIASSGTGDHAAELTSASAAWATQAYRALVAAVA